MTNRTFYMSVIAFAAAAAVNVYNSARAEVAGHAELMELINEDLDAAQDEFTLTLADAAGGDIAARTAGLDAAFFNPGERAVSALIADSRDGAAFEIASLTDATAEFEISKKIANMAKPFSPRLPYAPEVVAFVSEDH